MKKQKVALVEYTVYKHLVPLVSGYLKTYALQDAEIYKHFDLVLYTRHLRINFEQTVRELVDLEAQVYAFSCYVWNSALVVRVARSLLAIKKDINIILGGYQVAGEGETYLDSAYPNLVICNGEGEKTFVNYLHALNDSGASFADVRGLSFYRNEELVVTEPESRIVDINEIPSPFLEGVYDDQFFTNAVYETNRGCPFRCSFCAWGGPVSNVRKFSEDRVYQELDWMTKNNIMGIFLADANWGILKRDLAFSRYIAEKHKKWGVPIVMVMNMAKNRADRLVEIAKIFREGEVLTTQSIAVQSLNEDTLDYIDRKNIKLSAYKEAMVQLDEQGLGSYVEMIWPLPGETLASFKDNVESLSAMGAQAFIIYPLILLNGTSMKTRREEFQFVTESDATGVSEIETVTATKWVSKADVREGLWFSFAVLSLYNARTLWCLSKYLHRKGRRSFSQLFTDFSTYARTQSENSVVAWYANSVQDLDYTEAAHWGRVLHYVLKEFRLEFVDLLTKFVTVQDWYGEKEKIIFELDLVNAYFPYAPPRVIPLPQCRLQYLQIFDDTSEHSHSLLIKVPGNCLDLVQDYIELVQGRPVDGMYRVEYSRGQQHYNSNESFEHNANYCHAVMENVRRHVPVWKALNYRN